MRRFAKLSSLITVAAFAISSAPASLAGMIWGW